MLFFLGVFIEMPEVLLLLLVDVQVPQDLAGHPVHLGLWKLRAQFPTGLHMYAIGGFPSRLLAGLHIAVGRAGHHCSIWLQGQGDIPNDHKVSRLLLLLLGPQGVDSGAWPQGNQLHGIQDVPTLRTLGIPADLSPISVDGTTVNTLANATHYFLHFFSGK